MDVIKVKPEAAPEAITHELVNIGASLVLPSDDDVLRSSTRPRHPGAGGEAELDEGRLPFCIAVSSPYRDARCERECVRCDDSTAPVY